MSEATSWPAVRAALIAIALLANLVLALPAPERLTERGLRTPAAAEELDGWLELLGAVGLRPDRAWLVDQLVRGTNAWNDGRRVLQEPLTPVRRDLGINQNWALFARPETFPSRVVIEIERADGTTDVVYRALDPERDLLAPQLRYRRMRGVYDVGTRTPPGARNLIQWALERVLEIHPEARVARWRVLTSHSTRPGVPSDPKVEDKIVMTRTRGDAP